MLIAYDADGNVVATLDYWSSTTTIPTGRRWASSTSPPTRRRAASTPTSGRSHGAKGSKVWPECLGGRAHEFRVELDGPAGGKRIGALVHKESGHRRERAAIEAEIAKRLEAGNGTADIRDLVGGPDRPLHLDKKGKTAPRPKVARPVLPLSGVRTS